MRNAPAVNSGSEILHRALDNLLVPHWPQRVLHVRDLLRLDLVDLPGIHEFWVDITLTTYLAMAQRYPLGDFGARRVLDVVMDDNRPGEGVAATIRRTGRGVLRPYVLLSRSEFTAERDPEDLMRRWRRDAGSGLHPRVEAVEREPVVHEIAHALYDLAMECRGFESEMNRVISEALGVRYSIARHFHPQVQQRIREQVGEYALTEDQEFVALALASGILDGPRATPVCQALRALFDRRFRFDAPGSAHLAELVRAEYERAHHGPPVWRPKSVRPAGDLWDVPEWQPLHEARRSRGPLPSPEWQPLNFSGRAEAEAPLVVHERSAQDRTQTLTQLFPEMADRELAATRVDQPGFSRPDLPKRLAVAVASLPPRKWVDEPPLILTRPGQQIGRNAGATR